MLKVKRSLRRMQRCISNSLSLLKDFRYYLSLPSSSGIYLHDIAALESLLSQPHDMLKGFPRLYLNPALSTWIRENTSHIHRSECQAEMQQVSLAHPKLGLVSDDSIQRTLGSDSWSDVRIDQASWLLDQEDSWTNKQNKGKI